MNQQKVSDLENIINKNYENTAGIAVFKNGKVIYENYFNRCTHDSHIHIYSVTKSILSILIGIAIDKGNIKSLDQNVLDFFPNYKVKRGEKVIQNIKLKNLMTMTAPYKYKSEPYIKYFTSDDWLTFTLDLLGGKGQIGNFKYTPLIGPDIFSGIIVKATGKSVFDFASENLFSPLNISVERNIVFHSKEEQLAFNQATEISGWVADKTGLNAGGWGLTLSPMDMAKIGQLYLDKGVCNGKQIVSEKWIDESTKEHSRWEDLKLSYGYLWWVIDNEEHTYAAMGDGGNVIYVNEKKNMVVSIAATFKNNAKDRIELIKNYIEPTFED